MYGFVFPHYYLCIYTLVFYSAESTCSLHVLQYYIANQLFAYQSMMELDKSPTALSMYSICWYEEIKRVKNLIGHIAIWTYSRRKQRTITVCAVITETSSKSSGAFWVYEEPRKLLYSKVGFTAVSRNKLEMETNILKSSWAQLSVPAPPSEMQHDVRDPRCDPAQKIHWPVLRFVHQSGLNKKLTLDNAFIDMILIYLKKILTF